MRTRGFADYSRNVSLKNDANNIFATKGLTVIRLFSVYSVLDGDSEDVV